jgi:hypothetical protein
MQHRIKGRGPNAVRFRRCALSSCFRPRSVAEASRPRRRAEVRVKKGRRAVPPAQVPMSERNAGEDTGLEMTHRRAGQGAGTLEIKPIVET